MHFRDSKFKNNLPEREPRKLTKGDTPYRIIPSDRPQYPFNKNPTEREPRKLTKGDTPYRIIPSDRPSYLKETSASFKWL